MAEKSHIAASAENVSDILVAGFQSLEEVSQDAFIALQQIARTAVVLQHDAALDIELAVEALAEGDPTLLSSLTTTNSTLSQFA